MMINDNDNHYVRTFILDETLKRIMVATNLSFVQINESSDGPQHFPYFLFEFFKYIKR